MIVDFLVSNSLLLPIVAILLVAMLVAGAMLALSVFLGPKKYVKTKMMPYECGMDPVGSASEKISVKYYLVAILFLLFDLETAFLLPMALSWEPLSKHAGLWALGVFGFFMFFFVLSLWYDYKSKALEWEK